MDSNSLRESRVLWSFWIAGGLAVTGGVAPFLLAAGGTNRIAGSVIPFAVAAMALAAAALMYHQGRSLATSLYFIAGIALVYGMLSLIAVPLRLAVVGTCPVPPTPCPAGFERPFTTGEASGLAIGIGMGTLAILVGFFGLLMLYRIRPQSAWSVPTRVEKPAAPAPADSPAPIEPASKPAAVSTPAAGAEPAPIAEPAVASEPEAPFAAARPKAPRKPRAKRAPKPQAELAAPEERAELPAHYEPLELPAPEEPSES